MHFGALDVNYVLQTLSKIKNVSSPLHVLSVFL